MNMDIYNIHKYTQDRYVSHSYLLNDDGDYGYNHHDDCHYRLSC